MSYRYQSSIAEPDRACHHGVFAAGEVEEVDRLAFGGVNASQGMGFHKFMLEGEFSVFAMKLPLVRLVSVVQSV
ncbi:hypothetical protein GCM10027217_00810 [Pseudomaricurvus hydrocarbonicus]